MRWVCVSGNERERESVEKVFFSFFFYLLQYIFCEREIKKVCVGVAMGKN